MERTDHHISGMLAAWRSGNTDALGRLMGVVYAELHQRARGMFRGERANHTLQPTAVVHETYVRLLRLEQVRLADRASFFAFAARVMRQVLVDHARAKMSKRRGGPTPRWVMDDLAGAPPDDGLGLTDLLALDSALARLEAIDPRKSRIVELHFFAGMTMEETAEVVGVSSRTVREDWRVARAWLLRELAGAAKPVSVAADTG